MASVRAEPCAEKCTGQQSAIPIKIASHIGMQHRERWRARMLQRILLAVEERGGRVSHSLLHAQPKFDAREPAPSQRAIDVLQGNRLLCEASVTGQHNCGRANNQAKECPNKVSNMLRQQQKDIAFFQQSTSEPGDMRRSLCPVSVSWSAKRKSAARTLRLPIAHASIDSLSRSHSCSQSAYHKELHNVAQ